MPEQRRARAEALLLARQPDGPARTGAPAHGRSGSTTQLLSHMQANAIAGALGGGRAGAGLRQRGSARGRPRPLRQAPRRPPARALDGAHRRGPRSAAPAARRERDRIADDPAPRRAARRRGRDPARAAGAIADDILAYARAANVTHIVVGKATRSRLFEILQRLGGARPRAPAAATSASTSSPAKRRRPTAARRRRRSHRAAARRLDCCPTPSALARDRAPALGARLAGRSPISGVENVDLIFLTAVVGGRGALRPRAVARRRGRGLARLQLLLPAADLHLHHRRPDQRRRASCCSRSWRCSSRTSPPAPAHAGRRQPGAGPAPPRRSTASAASSPAAAPSTTCSGRPRSQIASMLRVRVVLLLPDGEARRRSGPAIRPRTGSTRPISPPRNGPSTTTGRPAAAPTRCRAPSACSCRCAPGAAPSG